LAEGNSFSRNVLVRLSRALTPDAIPNDFGDDPWLIALANSQGDVTDTDASYLSAFLLARALGFRTRASAEITIQTFEPVHVALASRQMSEEGWQLIERLLPWTWLEWDRCNRLRDAVAKLFVERDYPAETFDRLTSDDGLFIMLVANMAETSRGRSYLRKLKKVMEQSHYAKYVKRIEIIEKRV
jgi:hypothetical protein